MVEETPRRDRSCAKFQARVIADRGIVISCNNEANGNRYKDDTKARKEKYNDEMSSLIHGDNSPLGVVKGRDIQQCRQLRCMCFWRGTELAIYRCPSPSKATPTTWMPPDVPPRTDEYKYPTCYPTANRPSTAVDPLEMVMAADDAEPPAALEHAVAGSAAGAVASGDGGGPVKSVIGLQSEGGTEPGRSWESAFLRSET